jgi:uncharacterized protein (TIGR03086 family)
VSAKLPPAEEHRLIAGRFASLVDAADPGAWNNPSPVPEWTARDVVRHLIEWFAGFLESGTGVRLPDVPDVAEDPAGAWKQRSADIQALLEDPSDRVVRNPNIGDMPLAPAIDMFYTNDIFMHSWDLARALDLEPPLDEARAAELLAGAKPYEEAMRSSGQYGPRVEVPDGASAVDRLVGFIGRDPTWRRPAD